MIKSELFKLVKSDWLKGLGMAVGGALLNLMYQIFSVVPFDIHKISIDFEDVLQVAIFAALAYIGKQFSSNSEGVPFKKEPKIENKN